MYSNTPRPHTRCSCKEKAVVCLVSFPPPLFGRFAFSSWCAASSCTFSSKAFFEICFFLFFGHLSSSNPFLSCRSSRHCCIPHNSSVLMPQVVPCSFVGGAHLHTTGASGSSQRPSCSQEVTALQRLEHLDPPWSIPFPSTRCLQQYPSMLAVSISICPLVLLRCVFQSSTSHFSEEEDRSFSSSLSSVL